MIHSGIHGGVGSFQRRDTHNSPTRSKGKCSSLSCCIRSDELYSIVSHLGLISTTANLLPDALKEDARPKSDKDWRNTLVQLLLSRQSSEVVCTFSMLAASLSDGKPLPPCSVPALYSTSPDTNKLLSLGYMAEPGFIVYAAPRVVSELWRNQLKSVIE